MVQALLAVAGGPRTEPPAVAGSLEGSPTPRDAGGAGGSASREGGEDGAAAGGDATPGCAAPGGAGGARARGTGGRQASGVRPDLFFVLKP